MTTRAIFIVLLALAAWPLRAQSYRERINDGNEAYRARRYGEASKHYSAAREEDDERMQAYFNKGNVEYRKGAYELAEQQYRSAIKRSRSVEDGLAALYNLGTSTLAAADRKPKPGEGDAGDQVRQLRMAGYAKAIEAFRQVLKRDQDHEDARYNLVYAMSKLEQLQAQSQSGDKNKDKQKQDQQKQDQQKQDQQKKDQQKKDQQKQDQQKQDQQKQDQQKQDQQKQDQQKQEQGKQQQQQQGKPQEQQGASEQQKKMKQQQSEQILQALERHEKELQKKQREKRAVRVDVEKDW